jgi:putative HNHc nuclease
MKHQHPQRLSPPAQPGALLKRAFGIAQRMKLKELTDHDPVYLAMVRTLPCLGCGDEPSEAAHVRMQSGAHNKHGGMGKKPHDKFALPLCRDCHREQHRIGERAFWTIANLHPLLIAERLYEARGDLAKMRAIALTAVAERGE